MVSSGFITSSPWTKNKISQRASAGRLLFFLARHQFPHLENRDQRQVAEKEKQEEQKEADRSEKSKEIPPGRGIRAPGRREEIAVQTGHHDDDPPEPHAQVDDHGD